MINGQFTLTIDDMTKFKQLKDSVTYRNYIQDIVKSPVYKQVAQEHIDNIDISNDITALKSQMELSSSVLSKLYKNAISKMAISIIADTIILKELSELRIENAKATMKSVKNDMDEGFLEVFLMGYAPPEYYKKAEHKLKLHPDTNSVLYKGLIEYKKKNNTSNDDLSDMEDIKPVNITVAKKEATEGIDITGESIDLG